MLKRTTCRALVPALLYASLIAIDLVSPVASTVHAMDAPVTAPAGALPGSDSRPPGSDAIVKLDKTWKFKTDPMQVGLGEKWYAERFDTTSWTSLQSGKPWEAHHVDYAGYAWYVQDVALPQSFADKPLKITLAEIVSDDEVFLNGVRIGGLHGDYKYRNLLQRVYVVPAGLAHAGGANRLAIRIWGGRLGFHGAKSGLVAGAYTIEPVPYGLAAREPGEGAAQERPIELYDLSAAQRGHAFDLVFRFDPKTMLGASGTVSYKLTDFYGRLLKSGDVPLGKGEDGIARAVVAIDADTSRKIYLAGRFKAFALMKDKATGAVLAQTISSADHLLFAGRDALTLPPLPTIYQATPYGRLKLVDEIDAATPSDREEHPYLESGFGNHAQDFMTPGTEADVSVSPILGRAAREARWSWFAYRIGRGKLVPGHTYLVRISYPEDKPRFAPIEIQAGQNYMDIGWRNGVAPDDPYDNWPLSGAWQDYDVVVPLGTETLGGGGAGDGDAANGLWIYFMDHRKPGYYFSYYAGGAAVSSIKLYEIDPAANAPPIVLPPANLSRRVMTFDWERQPTSPPADIVAYAKLMGYSTVSPTILKWGLTNYAAPVAGYTSAGVDAAHYWVTGATSRAALPPASAAGPQKSVHEQYLDATRAGGLDYMPRIEYGGSNRLPVWARAVGPDGRPAKPDRFAAWGADLLDPATLTDFTTYLDALLKPYAAANPQLKGVLWRIRQDRMQISYSRADIAMFAAQAAIGGAPPDSASPTEAAEWATTPAVAPLYADWWQKKRADFHVQVARRLKTYRADMSLLYFNWDQDKFSLMQPDRTSTAFFNKMQALSGPVAYSEDAARRRTYTAGDYTEVLKTGLFSGALPQIRRPGAWPDYALLPSLYARIEGIELLAPVPGLPYANMPNYLNYFRTLDGLAVSNMVSYNEIGAREPNAKYETSIILPGGAPFSMAVELLAYYYGDVRTLTFTSYTYGRGFADAHRRFAQAFRALPAVPGTLLSDAPADVAARVYKTGKDGTYVGIAYKGYQARQITIDIPGPWTPRMTALNLVTNERRKIALSDGKMRIVVSSSPLQLHSFLIK